MCCVKSVASQEGPCCCSCWGLVGLLASEVSIPSMRAFLAGGGSGEAPPPAAAAAEEEEEEEEDEEEEEEEEEEEDAADAEAAAAEAEGVPSSLPSSITSASSSMSAGPTSLRLEMPTTWLGFTTSTGAPCPPVRRQQSCLCALLSTRTLG